MRRFAALLLPLMLAACPSTTATIQKERRDVLATVPVCCKAWDEMRFEGAPFMQPVERDIGPQGPAFLFDGEKSFFSAFELPRSDRTLVVEVEARLPSGDISSAMFYPVVAFLNDRKELAYTLPATAAGYVRGDLVRSDRLHTSVVAAPDEGWRYFVVYTTPEALKDGRDTITFVNPLSETMTYAGRGLVLWLPIAPRSDVKGLPASPVGHITVLVREHGRPG